VKTVILAGGLGTRMGAETASRPKALVEVGEHPIIWHILKIYQVQGMNDFVVCAGYGGSQIVDYFAGQQAERWRVRILDTGEGTATAGRLRRVREAIGDAPFCLTYGDGVANLDIARLLAFHRSHGLLATVTAVRPRLPFGVVTFGPDGRTAVGFEEKPQLPDLWVNSGFFVVEPQALDYAERDDESWEEGPLTRLAAEGQLAAYRHEGFWQCMDTPVDRERLDRLWRAGEAPWKVW
jgi:glucose-1-phosphate cytidylyltransferase